MYCLTEPVNVNHTRFQVLLLSPPRTDLNESVLTCSDINTPQSGFLKTTRLGLSNYQPVARGMEHKVQFESNPVLCFVWVYLTTSCTLPRNKYCLSSIFIMGSPSCLFYPTGASTCFFGPAGSEVQFLKNLWLKTQHKLPNLKMTCQNIFILVYLQTKIQATNMQHSSWRVCWGQTPLLNLRELWW